MKAGVRAQSNPIALQFPIDSLKAIICVHLMCNLSSNSIGIIPPTLEIACHSNRLQKKSTSISPIHVAKHTPYTQPEETTNIPLKSRINTKNTEPNPSPITNSIQIKQLPHLHTPPSPSPPPSPSQAHTPAIHPQSKHPASPTQTPSSSVTPTSSRARRFPMKTVFLALPVARGSAENRPSQLSRRR